MATKTKTSQNQAASQSILLEEYRSLQDDYVRLRSEGITRLNFFITSTSVALGGVFVLGSNPNLPLIYFKTILLVTLTMLSVVGLGVYSYLIHRDISSDRRLRGLARIRNHFAEIDPKIEKYFVSDIYDNPTGYISRNRSGMRQTTQVIEGIFVGSVLAMLSAFLTSNPTINIGIGVATTTLIVISLETNARRRF